MKLFNKMLLGSLLVFSGPAVFGVNNNKEKQENKSLFARLCDGTKSFATNGYVRLAVLGGLGTYGLYKGYQNRGAVREMAYKGFAKTKNSVVNGWNKVGSWLSRLTSYLNPFGDDKSSNRLFNLIDLYAREEVIETLEAIMKKSNNVDANNVNNNSKELIDIISAELTRAKNLYNEISHKLN